MPLNLKNGLKNRAAMLAASAAVLAMSAQGAQAAEMPQPGAQSSLAPISDRVETAHQWRGDRYDRRGRYRRNRGVSAGDVVAGVLILGAIAAIAGGNKDKNRNARARNDNRDYRQNNTRYSRNDRRDGYQSNGLNNAVDMCADQVERGDDKIANVDNAARNASGWSVSGSLEGGTRFDCSIDNEGRIRNVDIGGGASSNSSYSTGQTYTSAELGPQGTQHGDDVYARARNNQRTNQGGYAVNQPTYSPRQNSGSVDEDIYANDPRPAYPGGPLPGEAGYEEALGG